MFKFLLSLLFLASCGGGGSPSPQNSVPKINEIKKNEFFNVTYETISSRPIGSINVEDWQPVSGCREMKFATSIIVADYTPLPDNLRGNFTVALQNYGTCTGGNAGNFVLTFQDHQSKDTLSDGYQSPVSYYDSNLNPNGQVQIYILGMIPTRETMNPASQCRRHIYCPSESGGVNDPGGIDQENSPCNYLFKIVRFPDGNIIIDDISKGVQYYLGPRLGAGSASRCIQNNIR